MGFVTPELYLNNACFNDITKGDNGAFRASAGPDPCTGLGSPIGERLAALFKSPEATATRQLTAARAEIAQLEAEIASLQAGGGSTLEAAIRARAASGPRGIQSHLAPKGCCTIVTGNAPNRQIPGLTEAECNAIEDRLPGTATQWNPGACALPG